MAIKPEIRFCKHQAQLHTYAHYREIFVEHQGNANKENGTQIVS